MESEARVEHDPVGQKFTVSEGKHDSVLAYTEVNDVWDIFELSVGQETNEKGVAERLALAAFEYAKQNSIKIIPSHPYLRVTFLKNHPEYMEITTDSFY